MKRLVYILYSYKFIRYSIGGGLAALLDLFILWFFTDVFHFYYLVSAAIAFLFSFSFGYFFQKYITFKNYSKKHIYQGGLFLLFQLIGQALYMFILRLGVGQFAFYYLYVAIIAKGLVFIRNYISNYYFNFKN